MGMRHMARRGLALLLSIMLGQAAQAVAAPAWEYGFLVARASCGSTTVKVVSQVFRWCSWDYPLGRAPDVFRAQHKDEVLRRLAPHCGPSATLEYYNIEGWTHKRDDAERSHGAALQRRGREIIDDWYCSCEAYSSKCR
jgi:hypothetical protein